MVNLHLGDLFVIGDDDEELAFELGLYNPAHPIFKSYDPKKFWIEELVSEDRYYFDVAMARQLYAWLGTAIELHDQASVEVQPC